MARSTSTVAARKAAKAPAKKAPAKSTKPTPSTAEARTLVSQAVEAFKGHEVIGATRITPLAARATYAAKESGLLGSGEGAVYTGETFAALFGLKSKSIVTRWYRLGVALVEKGVDVDSPLWTDLLAGNKVDGVGAEIVRPGSTQTSIKRALKAVYLPDGRKRGSVESSGNGRSARTGTGSDGDTATRLSSAEAINAAIKVIAEHAPNLTAEEFSVVEDRLNAMIATMVKDRTDRATASRKSDRLVAVAQTG